MTTMRPCFSPSTCGVQSHRPGTQCVGLPSQTQARDALKHADMRVEQSRSGLVADHLNQFMDTEDGHHYNEDYGETNRADRTFTLLAETEHVSHDGHRVQAGQYVTYTKQQGQFAVQSISPYAAHERSRLPKFISSSASSSVSVQDNPFQRNWRSRHIDTPNLEHVSGGLIRRSGRGYLASDRYGAPLGQEVDSLDRAIHLVEAVAAHNPAGWTYRDSAE